MSVLETIRKRRSIRAYEDKQIPAEARIVAISPLGYPAENPSPAPRKKFEEVVSIDRW